MEVQLKNTFFELLSCAKSVPIYVYAHTQNIRGVHTTLAKLRRANIEPTLGQRPVPAGCKTI